MEQVENPTAKLKPALDAVFRFSIGQQVAFAEHDEHLRREGEMNGPHKPARYMERIGCPMGMMICERIVQECHGGVQLLYMVRRFTDSGKTECLQRFFEFELVPLAQAQSRVVVESKEQAER